MSPQMLGAWAASATVVLAADAGADRLIASGYRAHVVIGDFDSSSQDARDQIAQVIHDPDQDTSDCDKLLNYAFEAGYRDITLIGIEGDRLDHVLGTLYSAARAAISVRIALRDGWAQVLKGPVDTMVTGSPGCRLSAMPIGICSEVTVDGVEWPLREAVLDPAGLVSLSNRLVAPEARIRVQSGCLVVFVAGTSDPHW